MKIIKNILLFILNPLRTFGLGKGSDKVVSTVAKKDFVIYIIAFLVTAAIIYFTYFN